MVLLEKSDQIQSNQSSMALVEGKWSGGRGFMKKKKSSQGLLPDDWRKMDVDSGLTSGEVSGESSVARLDD